MALGSLDAGGGTNAGYSTTEKNYVHNAKEVLILFGRSTTGSLQSSEVVTDIQVLIPMSTRFMVLMTSEKSAVKELIPSIQQYCKQHGLELSSNVKFLIHYA